MSDKPQNIYIKICQRVVYFIPKEFLLNSKIIYSKKIQEASNTNICNSKISLQLSPNSNDPKTRILGYDSNYDGF